jgi:AraC-like DNA-binding protein
MHIKPLVPAHYISQIADYIEEKGYNSEGWLAQFELSLEDIASDKTLLDYSRFEKLILNAITLLGEAEVGLSLGGRLPINSHGALGFALLNCHTLRQAIELFQRYISIRTPLLALKLSPSSSKLKIELVELFDIGAIRRPFVETVILTFQQSLNFVCQNKAIFSRIELSYAQPEYWQTYQDLLGCEVLFSQNSHALYVDMAILDKSFGRTDQKSFKQAEAFCQSELERLKNTNRIVGQLRTLLILSNAESRNLSAVAERLHLSPRTLHRYLEKEHTSFKQILDEVRHTLAKQLFAQNFSVKMTAYELGYADVANFRRAFKRWQGCSPQDYIQHSLLSSYMPQGKI